MVRVSRIGAWTQTLIININDAMPSVCDKKFSYYCWHTARRIYNYQLINSAAHWRRPPPSQEVLILSVIKIWGAPTYAQMVWRKATKYDKVTRGVGACF